MAPGWLVLRTQPRREALAAEAVQAKRAEAFAPYLPPRRRDGRVLEGKADKGGGGVGGAAPGGGTGVARGGRGAGARPRGRDRPPHRVSQVELSFHHVVPRRRSRILKVRHEHLRTRVQRIDDHLAVHRPCNLHAPIQQIRGQGSHRPLALANMFRLLQKIRTLSGIVFVQAPILILPRAHRCGLLQPGVYRLAFERQHAKYRLMCAVQWLVGDEAFERLYAQRKLTPRPAALGRHSPLSQPLHVLRRGVAPP